MNIIFSHVHRLLLPDGTVQVLERAPDVREGDLIAPAVAGIDDEPTGKLVVKWVEDRHPEPGPVQRYYHLDWF